MRIGEIAKAVGLEATEVAESLGVDSGRGVAMRGVEDVIAEAYIATTKSNERATESEKPAEQPEAKMVRFWSIGKSYLVSGDGDRDDIQFRDWVYEGVEGGPEVALLRSKRDFFIARHTYEMVPKRHEDPMMIADFASAMMGIIHSGPGARTGDSISREGRDSIVALLLKGEAAKLSSAEKNTPRALTRKVAEKVSLKVEGYQEKL